MSDIKDFFAWATQQRNAITEKGGSGSGRYPKGSGKSDIGGEESAKKASVGQAMEVLQMRDFGASSEQASRYLKENGIDHVEGYHVASIENSDKIKRSGINISSQEGRTDASYIFLNKSEAINNANNLGHHGDFSIVTVKIPSNEAGKLRQDSFYVGTFSGANSAAKFPGTIPSNWVSDVSKHGKK